MIDVVLPDRNEKEFVERAEVLGYDSLFFLYNSTKFPDLSKLKTKLKLYQGVLLGSKLQRVASLTFVGNVENPRSALEFGVDVVFDLEIAQQKDTFHQRVSGLNQVICKIAKSKKSVIAFSFSTLLNNPGVKRARVIGRMQQNIKLCRKYKVSTAIASFAKNPFEMRAPHDLQALFVSLGMNQGEAKNALVFFEKKIKG